MLLTILYHSLYVENVTILRLGMDRKRTAKILEQSRNFYTVNNDNKLCLLINSVIAFVKFSAI